MVFGGQVANGGPFVNDTWVWDGATWSLVSSPDAPSPRHQHAMASVPTALEGVGPGVLLFGGRALDGAALGDTWWCDGVGWIPLSPTGPGPAARFGHCMAKGFALINGQSRGGVLLFGGTSDGVTFLGDTWFFDGASWTQVATDGPSARAWSAMLSTSAGTCLLGGFPASGAALDVWDWGGSGWSLWSPPSGSNTGPSARNTHTAVHDEHSGLALVFGGFLSSSGAVTDEAWYWQPGPGWMRSECAPRPTSRWYASAGYDSVAGGVVIFGGALGAGGLSNETWTFRLPEPPECPADLDDGSGNGVPDGGVSIDDLLYFVTQFAAGGVGADLDDDGDPSVGVPDGGVTIEDLIFFVAHLGAGC